MKPLDDDWRGLQADGAGWSGRRHRAGRLLSRSHRLSLIAGLIALVVAPGGRAAVRGAPQLRFSRLAENALAYLYYTRAVEFAVCLYGPVEGDVVTVERVEFTFISAYSESSVSAENCPAARDLLGMAHSHPDGDCRFSSADVAAFLARSGHPIDFVVCARNQVNWMNREEAGALRSSARSASPPIAASKIRGVRLREVRLRDVSDKPR
jgi:proteasome lid subunit RPN8/RPN11